MMARRSFMGLAVLLSAGMLFSACEADDGTEATDAGVDLAVARTDYSGGFTDADNGCLVVVQDGTSADIYICESFNPLATCVIGTGAVANGTLTVTNAAGSFTIAGNDGEDTVTSTAADNTTETLTESGDTNCSVAAVGGDVPDAAAITDACGKTAVECSDLPMTNNFDPCETNLTCAAETYVGPCRGYLRDLVACLRTIDAGDCAECDTILAGAADCPIVTTLCQ